MSDHFNQLRSSLIKRLEKAEPEIVLSLYELEKIPHGRRPGVSQAYNQTASKVFSDFFSELEQFWDSNEDKKRILLAGLILTHDHFLGYEVTNDEVSVSSALIAIIRKMLDIEAWHWFYEVAANFKQPRYTRTGVQHEPS